MNLFMFISKQSSHKIQFAHCESFQNVLTAQIASGGRVGVNSIAFEDRIRLLIKLTTRIIEEKQ